MQSDPPAAGAQKLSPCVTALGMVSVFSPQYAPTHDQSTVGSPPSSGMLNLIPASWHPSAWNCWPVVGDDGQPTKKRLVARVAAVLSSWYATCCAHTTSLPAGVPGNA